jgi:hypothetical protein
MLQLPLDDCQLISAYDLLNGWDYREGLDSRAWPTIWGSTNERPTQNQSTGSVIQLPGIDHLPVCRLPIQPNDKNWCIHTQ